MNKESQLMVTGANGHVGFNLVKMLLEHGYLNVRASVRDSADPHKTMRLKALGVTDIVSLDIRDEARFAEVSAGVDVLFHVAATYQIATKSAEADRELIEDSLAGVRSALGAAKENRITKVVLTSSSVTLRNTPPDAKPATEEDWRSDLDVPYIRAKTEAERLAWQLADEYDVNLVAMLPAAISGPDFGNGTQTTDMILAPMKGSMRLGTARIVLPLVDVRDVARGHILAAEQDAKGRFVLASDTQPMFTEVLQTMRNIDKSVPKPLMVLPSFAYPFLPLYDWMMGIILGVPRVVTSAFVKSIQYADMRYDASRAKVELGWRAEFSLEQTLSDTMSELRATAS